MSLADLMALERTAAPKVDFQRYAFSEATIRSLPAAPGVYWMRNREGRVIYVGKARSLAQRLAGYFRDAAEVPPKLQLIRDQIESLEFQAVGAELEALLLENRLISDYQPEINVQRQVEEGTSRYDFPILPVAVVAPSREAKRCDLFVFGQDMIHAAQTRVDPRRPPRTLLEDLLKAFLDSPSKPLPKRKNVEDWGREGNEICCRYFSRYKDRVQWLALDRSKGLEPLVDGLIRVIKLVASREPDPGEFRLI
jgi:hypothetical protein